MFADVGRYLEEIMTNEEYTFDIFFLHSLRNISWTFAASRREFATLKYNNTERANEITKRVLRWYLFLAQKCDPL